MIGVCDEDDEQDEDQQRRQKLNCGTTQFRPCLCGDVEVTGCQPESVACTTHQPRRRIAHKEPLVSSLLFWLSPRGPTRDLILNVRCCCCCCAYPAATELEHPSGHALVVHVASRYAARDVRPTRQPWTGRGRVRRLDAWLAPSPPGRFDGALPRRMTNLSPSLAGSTRRFHPLPAGQSQPSIPDMTLPCAAFSASLPTGGPTSAPLPCARSFEPRTPKAIRCSTVS